MITFYALINVLCLAGQIYFLWRVLNRNFSIWIAPFILLIISYFSTSFNYVEVIKELPPLLNETNINLYSTMTSYLTLNQYILMMNVLVFVAYLIVSIVARATLKTKT